MTTTMNANFAINTRHLSSDYAAGPINLEIDVPPTAHQCGVLLSIHLDQAEAALVSVLSSSGKHARQPEATV